MTGYTRPVRAAAAAPDAARDLTIILLTYSSGEFLAAAMERALACPAASILISDDASGLEFLRLAETWERKYPDRVRLLRRRRRRNAVRHLGDAIRHAWTPYFLALDVHDLLVPGYIELALDVISRRPEIAVVVGIALRAPEDHSPGSRGQSFPLRQPSVSPQVLSGPAAFQFVLDWSAAPCAAGAMYRADAFRGIGRIDPGIPDADERVVWLHLSLRWSIAYFPIPSVFARGVSSPALLEKHDPAPSPVDLDILRCAAGLCDDPEFLAVVRGAWLRAARLHARSAVRRLVRLRPSSVLRGGQAFRALAAACVLAVLRRRVA